MGSGTVSHPPPAASRAAAVVRLAAAWLLLGALAKVAWGTPADLPAVLQRHFYGSPTALLQAVAGLEILTAVLALIAPRPGWPLLAVVFGGFLALLTGQVSRGADSCGCFGPAIRVPPWIMLIADALVLGGVLAVRPWRGLRGCPRRPWSAAAALAAAGLGAWYVGRAAAGPAPVPVEAAPAPAATRTPVPAQAPPSPPATAEEAPAAAPAPAWHLPGHFPRFVVLAPDTWVGMHLEATALARWADVAQFPGDATIVFYYDTCDHCARHLRAIAAQAATEDYVFVQLPTAPTNRHRRVVRSLPPGRHVALPRGTRWIIQTPWDVVVRDRVVVEASRGEEMGEGE